MFEGFLRDPKASKFERVLPGGFSNNDDDDFCSGAPATYLAIGIVSLTVTSPADHLKAKVISAGGWHGSEVVDSEDGEGNATDVICRRS